LASPLFCFRWTCFSDDERLSFCKTGVKKNQVKRGAFLLPVLGGSQSVFWFPKRTEERGESEKGFVLGILSGEMFSYILRAAKLECPIGFLP